ncbi:hypothetical protein KY290_033722 [Solanum tuberosum]|uniref:Uncharacterized protein n=1 Tax=Solanum tuberosum TaxID=4113 RepID=A0ABQ7U160_SOLTU|nr:hypothetical protein KY289_033092 [Solanum tuberosum]KAH0647735.1 hypothetical protein KY285_032983 [Solanum tuberosum]KAH0740679.1 hypothetical protein KY290_033722 [Solanum tuberosum]
MMTQNKTKPSCARVKVEVNLLGELPMGIKREDREVVEKWIPFRYNYNPKYCKPCKLQGRNEKNCFVLLPELYRKEENEKVEGKERGHKNKIDKRIHDVNTQGIIIKILENKGTKVSEVEGGITRVDRNTKWNPQAIKKRERVESENKLDAPEAKKEDETMKEVSDNKGEDKVRKLNEGAFHDENNKQNEKMKKTDGLAKTENKEKIQESQTSQEEKVDLEECQNIVENPKVEQVEVRLKTNTGR